MKPAPLEYLAASTAEEAVAALARFDGNARVLRHAYRTLADDVRTGQPVTSAAEWLLDNFHLVTSEIRDIHRHLPGTYYRQLPTLASRDQAGHTRIYAMAVELLADGLQKLFPVLSSHLSR